MARDYEILSALTDIEMQWPVLMADISAASFAGGKPSIGPRRSSGPSTKESAHDDGVTRHDDGTSLPGGTERISLLAEAREHLFFACSLVVDERSENYDLGTVRLDATDCLAMAVWLRPHAGWIADHILGDETAEALFRIAATAKRLCERGGRKRPVIGACPTPECAGVLRGHIDEDDTAIDMTYDICCDANPEHCWAQSHWPRLGRLLEDEAAKAIEKAALDEGRAHEVRRFPELLDDKQLLDWLEERFRQTYAPGTLRTWKRRHGDTKLMRIWTDPENGTEVPKWDRLEVTKWRLGDKSVVGG